MDINDWKKEIVRAETLQEKQHKMWEDSIDMVNCDFFDRIFGNDIERVDVHWANWYINNLISLTYFRDPYIFIKGKSSNYSSFAQTLEQVVNISWKDLKVKQEFKRAIYSSLCMPPGWIKIGYTARIGQDVGRIKEEEEKSFIKDLKDIVAGVFEKKEEENPEAKGELNFYIKEESCFVSWVPSWNVLMPEGYHLVSRMPYLIEIEEIPIIDFINNPLYKNKKDLKPDRSLIDKNTEGKRISKVPFLKGYGSGNGFGDFKYSDFIRLYHIWDRRSNMRMTVSMNSEDYHFKSEWPYDMTGFPLKPLIFDETLPLKQDDTPYPINVLKPIQPQIIERSQLRTQMSKWRKRASAIILAQKGLLTEEDMAQLEESESLQIAYVSNIAAVQMTQTANLPQGVFDIDDVIERDLQSATNMAQIMFQPPPGTRTATQAQLAQSGLNLKSQARIDVVEDFTVEVAEALAQTVWQFYDRQKVSEIIGEEVNQEMWPDLPEDPNERRRIIKNFMKIRIDAGAAAPPKDETIDRKQILDFAQIINTIAPERLKKDELIKQLSEKFKFTKEIEKLVITNDEIEIQVAMEENKLLDANIPQIVGPNENHVIHIQVHSEGQRTPAKDQHILDHSKFMPQSDQSQKTRTADDVAKEGITNEGDVYQESQNLGVGTGPEAQ